MEHNHGNEVLSRYASGQTMRKIASDLGIGYYKVRTCVNKAGIMRNFSIPEEHKIEMKRLYLEENLLPREIASRFGRTANSVIGFFGNAGCSKGRSEGATIAALKSNKHSKGGMWHSTKTGKWEAGASILELLRMQQMDSDSTIIHWTKIVPIIPYGEGHRYIPDFIVTYFNGKIGLEEIKPHRQCVFPINLEKWAAARMFAADNQMSFKVITEKDLGGDEAVKRFNHEGLQQVDPAIKKARKKQINDEWRARNPGKLKQYKRDSYKINKEKVKQWHLVYRNKNKEKIAQQRSEHYEANKVKICQEKREREAPNREEVNRYMREYRAANKERIDQKNLERMQKRHSAQLALPI